MRISESCAKCLYDRQRARCRNEEYLAQVKKLIEEREENDMVRYHQQKNMLAAICWKDSVRNCSEIAFHFCAGCFVF